MASETDFAAVARQLISATKRSPSTLLPLFTKAAPGIVAQIQSDARRRGPLSFWGRSNNVDEIAGSTIVDPRILELIAAAADRRMSTATPHAGLQHTYGYLLSLIETPYGFKRERWTETSIETMFEFNPTTLSPQPTEGTLLSNATWLGGQIAYRKTKHLRRLDSFLAAKTSPDLLRINLTKLKHVRLTEKVSTTWRRVARKWTLQTDVVESPAQQTSLLVYSTIDDNNVHQLITLFPVSATTMTETIEKGSASTSDNIRLRYNAWVPALSGTTYSGKCRLQQF